MGAMVSFPYEDITYVVKNTFFLLELSVSPELIEISMLCTGLAQWWTLPKDYLAGS